MKLPSLAAFTSRLPRGNVLRVILCVLLGLGAISSVLDLMHEPVREKARAVAVAQQLVFDAQTATLITGGTPHTAAEKAKKASPTADASFDVADEEDATADAPTDTPPAAATTDDAATPTEADAETTAQGETLTTTPAAALRPVARTDESLVPAPAPEISEKSEFGPVPKISGDNSAAKLYARRYKAKEGTMSLAIVVTGLGFSQEALAIALSLPKDISLSFSPYAPTLDKHIEVMRNGGHEAWVDIPTQTPDYPATDPGPLGLIASLPERDMQTRLLRLLAVSPGVVGGIFAPNETLSEFPSAIKPILGAFADRGLMVLFTAPERASSLPPIPQKLRARVVDAWLASSPSRALVNSKLAGLLAATQQDGTYIIALEGTPQMLRLLKAWSEKIPPISPVKLVPLSALYAKHAEVKPPPKKEEAPKGH